MKGTMIQYVKGAKGKKNGIIYSFSENGKVYVGWSLCMKTDEFDKDTGFKIAVGRAYSNFDKETITVADSAYKPFIKFCDRVKRYYKTEDKPLWFRLAEQELTQAK